MTATSGTGPTNQRLPDGFAVRLAGSTVRVDGGRTVFGGSPARVVYLRPQAAELLEGTDELVVRDRRTAALARLLLDRGLAHPVPRRAAAARVGEVTVVVPVRDRPQSLARLLRALPPGVQVLVVDDGSSDDSTAAVARAGGVIVLRHEVSRGPAAARNTGLRQVRTPYVVFVDSDVVPTPGWIELLLGHLDDPAVGVVAPRVLALDSERPSGLGGWVSDYERSRSSLDLGPEPALVLPRGAVSYVPSACLLAVVAALGRGFEESMQVGEDVDLVWRVRETGWRVRYEPAATVSHEHRVDPREWLRRKAFYGTGAAPLAARHPGALAPVVLAPWTATVVVAVLAQRRWSLPVVAGACAVAVVQVSRRLRRSEHPVVGAARLVPYGLVSASWQCAGALTRHWWPLAVAAACVSRRARRALVVAALAEGVADWRRSGRTMPLAAYVIAHRLDDVAYGAGLWAGAWRGRTLAPLVPDLGLHRRGHSKKAGPAATAWMVRSVLAIWTRHPTPSAQ